MSDLNILFALNNNSTTDIEDSILEEYKKNGYGTFKYKKEFYTLGILKTLGEEKFDILVLKDKLDYEEFEMDFFELIKKTYSIRIIIILEERKRESEYIKLLYDNGYYDCIFKDDFDFSMLNSLINTGRNKKEAEEYYGVNDDFEFFITNQTSKIIEIDPIELEYLLIAFNKTDSEKINELLEITSKKYKKEQFNYLICILNQNKKTRMLLEQSNFNNLRFNNEVEREILRSELKLKLNKKIKKVKKIFKIV